MHGSANKTMGHDGRPCAQAQHGPVPAKKAGHIASAIPSAKPHEATRAARKKAFEAEFGNWLALQNARFEATGVPGVDLRPW